MLYKSTINLSENEEEKIEVLKVLATGCGAVTANVEFDLDSLNYPEGEYMSWYLEFGFPSKEKLDTFLRAYKAYIKK